MVDNSQETREKVPIWTEFVFVHLEVDILMVAVARSTPVSSKINKATGDQQQSTEDIALSLGCPILSLLPSLSVVRCSSAQMVSVVETKERNKADHRALREAGRTSHQSWAVLVSSRRSAKGRN